MPARLNFGVSTNIGNVATPVEDTDAATKAYVDSTSGSEGVPVVSFTTLVGPNNVYTSPLLSKYEDVTFIEVSLDGTVLQNSPGVTYYTFSGTNLTLVPYTVAGRSLQVAPSISGSINQGTVTNVRSSVAGLTFFTPTTTPSLTAQNVTSPTTQFLRADGTWSAPQVGLTSIGLTVPSPLAVNPGTLTANGTFAVTWAIGQIPAANLGSGSASNSTFLRGDGTWASPAGGGSVTSIGFSAPANIAFRVDNPSSNALISFQNVGASPTTVFLRGDGTWVSPSGSGSVVSVGFAAPANNAFGVANPTSNALISFQNVGATPTTVFLRGDGTWASIPSFSGVTSINGISSAVVLSSPKSDIAIQLSSQNINLGVNTSKITETLNAASATAGALTVDVSNNSAFTLSNLSGNTTLLVNGIASILTVNNQTFVFTIISNQAAATNYISNVTVTGSTINLRWLNNSTPTDGSASGGRDVYRFTFIKTGLTSYDVLATQGRY